jgi:hypothetical protein
VAKKSKRQAPAGPRGCPSSKMFDGRREPCIEPKGHKTLHRDIWNNTWK